MKESTGARTPLTRDGEGRWSGAVTVNKGVAEVGVYADIGTKNNEWLLSYQVRVCEDENVYNHNETTNSLPCNNNHFV